MWIPSASIVAAYVWPDETTRTSDTVIVASPSAWDPLELLCASETSDPIVIFSVGLGVIVIPWITLRTTVCPREASVVDSLNAWMLATSTGPNATCCEVA